MPTSRITAKGQATIPKSIRRILNVRPSDRISFHVSRGRVWVEGVTKEAESLFGKYARTPRRKVSIEDMHAAVRKRASQ